MFVDNTIPELTMGQKLKMFREINNLSQEQLGQKLNVTDKTISAWETGEREINLTNAKTICELFNIPNSYFVFNENFKSINDKLQNQIRDYIKDMEFRNKVEKVINICKQKINDDAIPLKKEYLPVFDFDNKHFISYGLFDENNLPIKTTKRHSDRGNDIYYDLKIDDANLENKNSYTYSSLKLSEYGLFDTLQKYNGNKVELSDLINCNNLETFKTTLAQTKSKKYTQKNIYNPFAEGRDISSEHLQSELNKTLENLNPNLSKFWEIIVFLIDNGAYYTKQIGWGTDAVCWKEEIDISKTNLVYRLAKDKITK